MVSPRESPSASAHARRLRFPLLGAVFAFPLVGLKLVPHHDDVPPGVVQRDDLALSSSISLYDSSHAAKRL